MKSKLTKLLFGILISIIILIAAGPAQALADSTADNDNNYAYPMSTYKKPVLKPYSLDTSAQTEDISAGDGSLEIRQTDLSLKGKNGLDFDLTRIYRSASAMLDEPQCYSGNNYRPVIQGFYVSGYQYTDVYTNGNPTSSSHITLYFGPPASGSNTGLPYQEITPGNSDATYWQYSQQAEKMADDFNAGLYLQGSSVITTSGSDTILTVTTYQYFSSQVSYVYGPPGANRLLNDYTVSPTANDKYFNLGTGWSFDLPYIEQRGSQDFYLNLGSQGVIHFDWDINYYDSPTIYQTLADSTRFNIPFEDTYRFSDLQLNYIVTKSTHIFTTADGDASFELTEKDGKKLYFGHNGGLMAIVDRFGNEIQFLHNSSLINGSPLIQKIIDSVGRIITLNYDSSGYPNETVTLEVDDPTNPANNRTVVYNKTAAYNQGNNITPVLLNSVTDAEGRVTQYTYQLADASFSYWRKDPYTDQNTPSGIDYYELLKTIIYPTGGSTQYTYNTDYSLDRYSYKNLGFAGFLHFYKVTDRADYASDGTMYNHKNYNYHNYFNGDGTYEYDGYPNSTTNTVTTEVTDAAGNCDTYTYNYLGSDMLCTDILDMGPDHKKETLNTYDYSSKLLKQSINRTYNLTSGAYLDKIENYTYDNQKNITAYWDPQANGNTSDTEHKTTYTYGANSLLTNKTYKRDANNTISEQYTLSSDGKTVTQAQVYENGVLKKQTGYTYDSSGNVMEERDYLDNWSDYISTHFDYTDNDSTRNGQFNGLYMTRKWVEGVKDADGNAVEARSGNPAGTVDETDKYDWFGNLVQKQDGQGNLWSKTYDKLNRVLSETNPGNTAKTYVYTTSPTENSVLTTDERGTQIKSGFDPFGNQIYTLDMASGQYLNHYTFDSLFRLQTEDNNNSSLSSRTLTYQYYSDGRKKENLATDKNGQLLSQEDFVYDDANAGAYNKVTKTVAGDTDSPAVSTVAYTNNLGQVVKQGRVHNGTELLDTYQYDYLGNKTQEKSARAYDEGWSQSYTTQTDYDYAGKPIMVYNVNGEYISTQYDALGRKTQVTDIKGNKSTPAYSTTYIYDNMGRVIEEDIPFENNNGTIDNTVKKHYYDRDGNIILEKISSNKPGEASAYAQTGYEYNSRNLLTKVIPYTNGSPVNYTQYYYDAAGNKVRMYTGLNQPLQINGLDNVTSGGDSDYSVTKYDYDRFNKLQSMTDPLGQQEQDVNDLNGNLVRKTDRNGSVTTMTYDGLGRMLSKSVTNGQNPNMNASYTYTYSITGNRTAMSGEGASSTSLYDDLGRLITENDGSTIEKDYTYDAADNRKSLLIKENGQVKTNTSYDYDNLNRLWHVYEDNSPDPTATYAYDDNGNRSSLIYANGDSTAYQYNLANKLTQLANQKGATVLSQYNYTYYLNGNQANKTDNTGKSNDYVYDGLGRLGTETETIGGNATTSTYTYDDANNRLSMTVTGSSPYNVSYNYDENNRLTTETKVSDNVTQKTTYGYDNNGNQTSSITETTQPVNGEQESLEVSVSGQSPLSSPAAFNEYDGFNQLIRSTAGDKTVVNTYNGDGLRASKTVNGATTKHIWDGDQIALETDGSGNVTAKYLRGVNLIASDDGSGTRKYFDYNGHGDVTGLADLSGNLTKSYDYDAFGNEKNIDPNDTNVFRYSGEYYDKETGTYYLRARYYDPSVGRFISEDSVKCSQIELLQQGFDNQKNPRYKLDDPMSLNLYTYCGNDPVIRIDPSGHFFWALIPIAILAAEYGPELVEEYGPELEEVGAMVEEKVEQVLINQQVGAEFENLAGAQVERGVMEAGGTVERGETFAVEGLSQNSVRPDFSIYDSEGNFESIADAKTSDNILNDDQAKGFLQVAQQTTEKTLTYITPTGKAKIADSLYQAARRVGVTIVQMSSSQ